MSGLTAPILLLCVVTGYSVTVETRNIGRKELSEFTGNVGQITRSGKIPLAAIIKLMQSDAFNKKRNLSKESKETRNELQESVATLSEIKRKDTKKQRRLRNGDQIGTVGDFLQKLNNFMGQNTYNNFHMKRPDVCNFGFGSPGSRKCKREKFRHSLIGRLSRTLYNVARQRAEETETRRKYAQHLLEERAKYNSSSHESNSDNSDMSDKQVERSKKSRFQIVDNLKGKRQQGSSESDDNQSDSREGSKSREIDSDEPPKKEKYASSNENTDDNVSGSDEYERKPDHNALSDNSNEQTKEISAEPDDKNSDKDSDESIEEKYMYLQGSRLQHPKYRADNADGRRDPSRMAYFMPKRYKWNPEMIHDLDNFWETQISVDRDVLRN